MDAIRLHVAWNTRRGSIVADAFTDDGARIEHALPGAHLAGRAAIAAHVQVDMDAVHDCRLELRNVVEGRDGTVTIEWTFVGVHTRDLPGLPACDEPIALDGVSVCTMEGELIKEERVYWDAATLLAGAGVLGLTGLARVVDHIYRR